LNGAFRNLQLTIGTVSLWVAIPRG
jgi:hypothetical protein